MLYASTTHTTTALYRCLSNLASRRPPISHPLHISASRICHRASFLEYQLFSHLSTNRLLRLFHTPPRKQNLTSHDPPDHEAYIREPWSTFLVIGHPSRQRPVVFFPLDFHAIDSKPAEHTCGPHTRSTTEAVAICKPTETSVCDLIFRSIKPPRLVL